MTIFDAISLLGGLSLFLYGMRIMGDGLKKNSNQTMKNAIGRVTNNPLMGFFLGVIVTAIIQSSNATIVITAGLVGAGMLTLRQSVGVVLGANVGTTITGQIIRLLDVEGSGSSLLQFFQPKTLSSLAALAGIILIMFIRRRNSGMIGEVAMGFGILFTGLLTMTAAVKPLSGSPAFERLMMSFSDVPALGFLAGLVVCTLIQSSSAAVGILQALCSTGELTFSSVYAILLGIYIGCCIVTAILCSLGAKPDARRTGVIDILVNGCGVVVVLIVVFLARRIGWLDGLWNKPMTSGDIANANTVFKLLSALVLIPCAGLFYKLSHVIVRDPKKTGADEAFSRDIGQLDDKLLLSPTLALTGVKGAVLAMSRLAAKNVKKSISLFDRFDGKVKDEIAADEDRIDQLADAVDNYMIRLSASIDTKRNSDILNYYIQCFSEIERIGDYAVNLSEDAEELAQRKLVFSESALRELDSLGEAVSDIVGFAAECISSLEDSVARRVEPLEEVIDDLVGMLKNRHIERQREGTCSVYVGIEYVDVLVNVERISDQCSNVALYTLSLLDASGRFNPHEYINTLHQGLDPAYQQQYAENRTRYLEPLL